MTSENELPRIKRGGGRIEYIGALKGFAICCIVLGHVVNGYLDVNTYPAASAALYRIFNIIYAFHMPLFMTISGYMFEIGYFGKRGSVKYSRMMRQILNLFANYIVFSIFYGFVRIAMGGHVNSGITLRDLLLIWARPIDLYWYIYGWLSAVGKHSLEIYLLHCFLTVGIRIVFARFGISNAVAGTLLNFVLSTTIPLMFSFCCTRMGIYDLVFKPVSFIMEKRREG